jgi:hypothetical protein
VRLVLVSLLFGTAGCGETYTCHGMAIAGLSVQVLNEITHRPICDAEVTATDGSHTERLSGAYGPECTYAGASERPGTYTITVTHDRFSPASVEGVRVRADECHVQTQSVTLNLSPIRECTPGDTFSCSCPSGLEGTQRCGADWLLSECEGC